MSDFCNAYWALEDAAAEHGLTMEDLEDMATARRFCTSCGVDLTANESGRCSVCWQNETRDEAL